MESVLEKRFFGEEIKYAYVCGDREGRDEPR
jgi:hypothetical protein